MCLIDEETYPGIRQALIQSVANIKARSSCTVTALNQAKQNQPISDVLFLMFGEDWANELIGESGMYMNF